MGHALVRSAAGHRRAAAHGQGRRARPRRGGARGRYDHVVLIYFDAFGWRFAEQHGDHPLLRDAAAVERLTSQFPSTTTVHTPTIHSGLPVGEHGLYEWFVLEPSLNRLVTPLPFCFAGDNELDGLTAAGMSPDSMFPQRLALRASRRLRHRRHTWRSLRRTRTRGRVAACCVARRCIRSRRPSRRSLLPVRRLRPRNARTGSSTCPTSTRSCTMSGPTARESRRSSPRRSRRSTRRCVAMCSRAGTLVLVTADHGMTAVSPERTSYVNVMWPEIADVLTIGADGKPLAPAGSCRDLFLHVRPGERRPRCRHARGSARRHRGGAPRRTAPRGRPLRSRAFGCPARPARGRRLSSVRRRGGVLARAGSLRAAVPRHARRADTRGDGDPARRVRHRVASMPTSRRVGCGTRRPLLALPGRNRPRRGQLSPGGLQAVEHRPQRVGSGEAACQGRDEPTR